MVEPLNCDITLIDNALSKRWGELSDNEQDDINRRINDLMSRVKAVAAPQAQLALDQSMRTQLENNYATFLRQAHLANISPSSGRSLSYHLAQQVALTKTALGLGDEFTQPGAVREALRRATRKGQGTLHQSLASIHLLDQAADADRVLERLRKRLRISRDDWHRIKLDTYEVGLHPYLQKDFGIVGPEGIQVLKDRQTRLYNLLSRHGVDAKSADVLANEITKVVNSYRATLEILQTLGVKIESANQLVNYLPRSFSPETLRRFAWSKNGDSFDIFGIDGGRTNISLPAAFTKSRSSNLFVVEDKALLDTILRGVDPDIYSRLGLEVLDDVLEDTNKLTRVFIDFVDKKNPAVFDALVDSGIVSKLPMTSTELFQYAKLRYQLPFKTVDEFMPYSFSDMALAYRSQAEKLVGRSLSAHYTVEAAVKGGWGVTEYEKLMNPAYEKYVKLASPVDPNTVFTQAETARFGLDPYRLSEVYVHPTVGEMYKAMTTVLTDPNQMGFVGRLLWDLKTTFSAQALTTTGFVFRQLYTPLFQVWAGGGRLDLYAKDITRSIAKVAELSSKGKSLDSFDEMFDDARAVYRFGDEVVTERELWRRARANGEVQEVIPWLGVNLQSRGYQPDVKIDLSQPLETVNELGRAVNNNIRYLRDVLDNHEDLGYRGTLSEIHRIVSSGPRRINDKAFHWIGASNILFDNIGKFSLLKALTDTSTSNRMMRSVQGNFRNSLDYPQAVQRMRQFFFDYSDAGRLDTFMTHVKPFYMFMSRNTFAIWRMMVREPGKFMAYQRLWAAINAPERDQEPPPDGALHDWQRDTAPLMWIRRDADGEPTEIITLPRTMFDPVAEGTESVSGTMDTFLKYMGVWPQAFSNIQSTGDMPWMETETNKAIASLASESYGHWKSLMALVTGFDPNTGYRLRGNDLQTSSLLGVEVTPMFRYMAENLLPMVRNINRSNPFYMFGRPPEIDRTTGEIVRPGTPAWFGGAPRSSRDATGDFRTWWQRTLAVVGFNVYTVNVMEQMGFRQSQIQFAVSQGYQAIAKKEASIRQLQDPRQIERELAELEEMKILHAALVLDYNEILAWTQERGMNFPAGVRYMQKYNMSIEQIQTLSEDQRHDLLREIYGEDEWWKQYEGN